MTVSALIKLLQAQDPKRIVVMSCDAEGNAHSPLADLVTMRYDAETTWSGTIHSEDEDDSPGKPALVLYPTN